MLERRLRVPLGGALVLTAAASPAHALDVQYEAPASCPARGDFVAAIERRGVHLESTNRELSVRITEGTKGFLGELSVTTEQAASEPRRVDDADCSRVTDGLAAVAAIVLGTQPEAETAAPLEPEATPAAEAAAPTNATAVAVETAPAEPPLRGSAFTGEREIWVDQGKLEIRPSRAWLLTAGADFGTIPGLVLPRYDLTASLATFLVTPDDASHLVGPLLQVRWSFLGPGTHESNNGRDTDVWGIHAGAASCFPFNYDTRGLTLLGCAEFMAEYMSLVTQTPSGVIEQDTGSGSVALVLDARYDLAAGFHLGLRGGGRLRFGKLTARDEQDRVLFESGMAGAFVTAGVGYSF